MKSTTYSDKVLDHFRNPRNVGELEGEDVSLGRVGNPVCGDLMDIYIKVEKDAEGVERITDIKFKTFGCGSAVATSSMITELAKGKTLEEALEITRKDVADELDGLPPIKMHCSNLAADALHEAIKNYIACRETPGDESTGSEVDQRVSFPEIQGENEYQGKGLYHAIENPEDFVDKRVLIYGQTSEAIRAALSLMNVSGRIVLVTPGKEFTTSKDLRRELQQSDVKVLYESELLSVGGFGEVENVRIHDKDEDEEYDLFVDSVIIVD